MRVLHYSCVVLGLLMFAASGNAQSTPPTQSEPSEAPASRPVSRRSSAVPCWRQAGMTADMVNKRWQIEDQQKTSIAAVCSDRATSPKQKHDKIDEIHADTDHALAQLIPTKELTVFNKCMADVEQKRPKPAGQKELGPCGGVIPANAVADETSAPEHQHNGHQAHQ